MRAELFIRKRIWKLMIALVALYGAVLVRIISLTVIQGEELTARGVKQWTQEGKVEARRGSIVDRNGETLALSTTAYSCPLIPNVWMTIRRLPMKRQSCYLLIMRRFCAGCRIRITHRCS